MSPGVDVLPPTSSAACPGSWLGAGFGWPLQPWGVLTGSGLVRPQRRARRRRSDGKRFDPSSFGRNTTTFGPLPTHLTQLSKL